VSRIAGVFVRRFSRSRCCPDTPLDLQSAVAAKWYSFSTQNIRALDAAQAFDALGGSSGCCRWRRAPDR